MMTERAPRRSLAARRRATNNCGLDENDEIDDSLNESLNGRRGSRLLNCSVNGIDEPTQTPSQLVDLYQKTVELATQGKINIKNAFNIPLVERLPQVLNIIALDDKDNHNLGPNFVKAGSVIDTSAKIYGYRVDALHSETQKLSGNILNSEEDQRIDENQNENEGKQNSNQNDEENKKVTRRVKQKLSSFLVSDITKITLDNEFEFRPLQAPSFCQWRGGIGADSIYAEMVSSTMYSSSDFALIDGITNANNQIEQEENQMESLLSQTQTKPIDLSRLREIVKSKEHQDHLLGNANLRDFSFNENSSTSFINTIHESSLTSIDDSFQQLDANYPEDVDDDNEPFSHEELISAAIEDLNEDCSQTGEIFKNALNELSQPQGSSFHSTLPRSQLTQSNFLATSFLSSMSFAEQMPDLLNSKNEQSEYSYFDAAKLKLFAGPNIWKYTNLLHDQPTETSTVQQKQAMMTPKKLINLNREPTINKRSIRVDIFQTGSVEKLMSKTNLKEKRSAGTSQSAVLLRGREKNLNQMQLARKIRKLTDLTNFHHFPDLNSDLLERINRRFDRSEPEIRHIDEDEFHSIENDYHDENDGIGSGDFEFVRPVHYERIEFAKGSSSVNPKVLKRQMIEEFSRQKNDTHTQRTQSSLDTTNSSQHSSSILNSSQTPVEFSILCEHLADQGHLSVQNDLASAFYCMLINCNENKLYMKSIFTRDDLLIQEQPFTDRRELSTLSYSYASHSNLSFVH